MIATVHGIDLHWEATGEGETLVFLHGMMGCGADWRHLFSQPPEGFRILAPDLRGHGATANPTGELTFRQCARDVLAWLGQLGLSRAFELHRAIPRSRLWVVPNGGHAPVFGEAAAQFATTALAFLRGEWR